MDPTIPKVTPVNSLFSNTAVDYAALESQYTSFCTGNSTNSAALLQTDVETLKAELAEVRELLNRVLTLLAV